MHFYNRILAISLFCLLCFTSTSLFAAKHTLTPQIGAFSLFSDNNNGRDYETKSQDIIKLEYEARVLQGLSIGTSFIHYKNHYKLQGSENVDEASSLVAFFNVKKYFNGSRSFQPYIGLGGGLAFIGTNESDSFANYNDYDGYAGKIMGGFALDFGQMGFNLEYLRIYAEPEDGAWLAKDKLDISGHGLMLGMRIRLGR